MKTLIVPRKTIYFEPHEGSLIKLSENFPESLKQPIVRSLNGYINGFESGYRSGIIEINSESYKLKGCRPSERIICHEPKGSQYLFMAQSEAETVQEIRQIYMKEGYTYPIEPIGFWIYDNILVKGEQTAATLYRIKGDTRLDEFLWWLEENLPFHFVPNKEMGSVQYMFEIFGVMTGRLIRVLHNHNYSWDWIGRFSNAYTGNVVVYLDDSENIKFGLVDVDNVQKFNPESESSLMKKMQEHDLRFFEARLFDYTILSGSRARKLKTIQKRMGKYVFHTFSNFENEHKLIENGIDIFQNGESNNELDSFSFDIEAQLNRDNIRGSFFLGLGNGYKNPDMQVPEISLDYIKKFRQHIQTIGDSYKNKVKADVSKRIGSALKILEMKRKEEEERKYRHWRRIDDGYGFSDGSRISVMFDDWIPRIRVYSDHTQYCLEGVSPEFGMIEPDIQGFNKSDVFFRKAIPMTADEVSFHFEEVSEALRWWDSDMKSKDENNVFPSKDQMANLYREVFKYGLEKAQLPNQEKSHLMNLAEAL